MTPKPPYVVGAYYVGIGSSPEHPAIISGPFDGARPVLEGHTLYVYHQRYGFVKVD